MLRRKKFRFLETALKDVQVAALQEVHGSEDMFRMASPFIRKNFRIESSFKPIEGNNRTAGGVVTLLRVPRGAKVFVASSIFAAGRVLRTVAELDGRKLIFWNVHNFGVTAGELNHVVEVLNRDVESAAADDAVPSFSFSCTLLALVV